MLLLLLLSHQINYRNYGCKNIIAGTNLINVWQPRNKIAENESQPGVQITFPE